MESAVHGEKKILCQFERNILQSCGTVVLQSFVHSCQREASWNFTWRDLTLDTVR